MSRVPIFHALLSRILHFEASLASEYTEDPYRMLGNSRHAILESLESDHRSFDAWEAQIQCWIFVLPLVAADSVVDGGSGKTDEDHPLHLVNCVVVVGAPSEMINPPQQRSAVCWPGSTPPTAEVAMSVTWS